MSRRRWRSSGWRSHGCPAIDEATGGYGGEARCMLFRGFPETSFRKPGGFLPVRCVHWGRQTSSPADARPGHSRKGAPPMNNLPFPACHAHLSPPPSPSGFPVRSRSRPLHPGPAPSNSCGIHVNYCAITSTKIGMRRSGPNDPKTALMYLCGRKTHHSLDQMAGSSRRTRLRSSRPG